MLKSQAVNSIMQIVLMIAVIVVGVSFLLRGFGIDIFGFLNSKFQSAPQDGLALHVRVGLNQVPGSSGDEIFEFHLTNGDSSSTGSIKDRSNVLVDPSSLYHVANPTYTGGLFGASGGSPIFGLDAATLPKNGCAILTTNSPTGGVQLGQFYKDNTYVAKPGTTIQSGSKGCNSLNDCINRAGGQSSGQCNIVACLGKSGTSNWACQQNQCYRLGYCNGGVCSPQPSPQQNVCEPGVECFKFGNNVEPVAFRYATNSICTAMNGKDGTSFCDNNDDVLKVPFSSLTSAHDACGDVSQGKQNDQCNLLAQQNPFQKAEIKYGVLCGGDNKWHVCNDALKDQSKTYGSVQATCGLDGNDYSWNVQQTAGTGAGGTTSGQATAVLSPSTTDATIDSLGLTHINLVLTVNKQATTAKLDLDSIESTVGKCSFFERPNDRILVKDVTGACSISSNPDQKDCTFLISCGQPGTYHFKGVAYYGTDVHPDSNAVQVRVNAAQCPGSGIPNADPTSSPTWPWGGMCESAPSLDGSPTQTQTIHPDRYCVSTAQGTFSVAGCEVKSPGTLCWYNGGQCY